MYIFCSHIFGYALYRLYVVRALQVDRHEEYGQSICLCARDVRVTEPGHSGLLRHVSSCQPGGYLCRILSRGRPELWGPFDVTERERGGGGGSSEHIGLGTSFEEEKDKS